VQNWVFVKEGARQTPRQLRARPANKKSVVEK
jgi:hypothetical protein